MQADISDEEAVQRLFDTAIRELGALTVLINNAGITGKLGLPGNIISSIGV